MLPAPYRSIRRPATSDISALASKAKEKQASSHSSDCEVMGSLFCNGRHAIIKRAVADNSCTAQCHNDQPIILPDGRRSSRFGSHIIECFNYHGSRVIGSARLSFRPNRFIPAMVNDTNYGAKTTLTVVVAPIVLPLPCAFAVGRDLTVVCTAHILSGRPALGPSRKNTLQSAWPRVSTVCEHGLG